jgi:tetratricopeptide (TPR) repeat protein
MRLGQSYMQKGEYEKALKEYQNALQRAPQAWGVHVHLAALYVLLDRQEEANASLNRVLVQFPSFSRERAAQTTPFKNEAFHRLFFDALRKAELEAK